MKHEISITSWYSSDKLTIQFNNDTNANDIKDIFATIMKFLTFWEQEWLKHND